MNKFNLLRERKTVLDLLTQASDIDAIDILRRRLVRIDKQLDTIDNRLLQERMRRTAKNEKN